MALENVDRRETVRCYAILYRNPGGELVALAKVVVNFQRLRHRFWVVEARGVRVHMVASNAEPVARSFETCCYG